MTKPPRRAMRDVFWEKLYAQMPADPSIFILADDLGAPVFDKIRQEYPDRFINVGIAEQNLLNVAVGLAIEGHKVYAYAIAPFFLRAYEILRILAIFAQERPLNINLVGIGVGVSYDVSGPTHHCLEDLTAIRGLPHIDLFSPCDLQTTERFVQRTLERKRVKYIRLDGKPQPWVYGDEETFDFEAGFKRVATGERVCLVSTGFMTRKAMAVVAALREQGIAVGLVDVFGLNPIDRAGLASILAPYETVVTLEEGFINRGGLDSLVAGLYDDAKGRPATLRRLGFRDRYLYRFGTREFLYQQMGVDQRAIVATIADALGIPVPDVALPPVQ